MARASGKAVGAGALALVLAAAPAAAAPETYSSDPGKPKAGVMADAFTHLNHALERLETLYLAQDRHRDLAGHLRDIDRALADAGRAPGLRALRFSEALVSARYCLDLVTEAPAAPEALVAALRAVETAVVAGLSRPRDGISAGRRRVAEARARNDAYAADTDLAIRSLAVDVSRSFDTLRDASRLRR